MQFCKEIAEGLKALHHCGIVHGDVKPENILVFPKKDARNSFTLKITDFGHSVLKHDGLKTLPALTKPWCAPEVETSLEMTFQEMILTDCYSYGLVILSVMIDQPFYEKLDNIEEHKNSDRMLAGAIELLRRVDRESNGLDIDIETTEMLLEITIQLNPGARDLASCISLIDEYISDTEEPHLAQRSNHDLGLLFNEIPPLDVVDKVIIGYQTLSRASHQLKSHIAMELLKICNDATDIRKPSAAWELCLCYFVGFGVPQSFEKSSRWLSYAADNSIVAAQDYFHVLHEAMKIDPPATSRPYFEMTAQRLLSTESSLPAKTTVGGCANPKAIKNKGETDSSPELSSDVTTTISKGTVSEVSALFTESRIQINSQNACGDTPLLIAAKSGRFDVIDLLLEYPSVNAGIRNLSGQTVLHYLPTFNQSQVYSLVPRLMTANADLNAEGRPTDETASSTFSNPSIKSCSFLNVILHKRPDILECLLEAAHSKESSCSSCTFCKGGSRFRRILAVTLSLFNADALDIISDHMKEYQARSDMDLSKVEVWSGPRLFPIYHIPFCSVVVAALDIPDSIFRAIHYGERYLDILKRCIDFLLGLQSDSCTILFAMLNAAVDQNSVDGVKLLLDAGRDRGAPTPQWWLAPSPELWLAPALDLWFPGKTNNSENLERRSPVFKSISYGLRESVMKTADDTNLAFVVGWSA
ncbi:unnamed protein product [Clonostachys rosea]|uniref:Protein kinase domain-containing protein n=1 Tax=Bionectria ochroleuca TaxID=29856 RepID=A0ABY6UDH7_BIOOC|nr:unnamed protein product [Clonostachys rosea]